MGERRVKRRHFLLAGAACAAGGWLGYHYLRKRVNVAMIGIGGQGARNLDAMAGENVVALCDVDEHKNPAAFQRFPRARRHTDYRRMLEQQPDIEAVVVSTPDHQHAHACLLAMEMGKHCYCEKPLSQDIAEARRLQQAARRSGVATQMGNQGTATSGFRKAVELIRSGALGPVNEVHAWTNRPTWQQGMREPAWEEPVPGGVHWDLWLGTAPARPYSARYMPFAWRGWWDFGTGAIGDMACHILNLPFVALNLRPPTRVSPMNDDEPSAQSPPANCRILYEFPARSAPAHGPEAPQLPPLRLTWYERQSPLRELFLDGLPEGAAPSDNGCLVVGTRGTLYASTSYGSAWQVLPRAQFQDLTCSESLELLSLAHQGEWLRACKDGTPTSSSFADQGAALTEVALLGNVALRANTPIEWDAENMRVTNHPAAEQYLRRTYRRGWEL